MHGKIIINIIICIDGVTVDWVSNKLYWTDAELKTVEVLDLLDRYRATLISTGSSSIPRAIIVDPKTRCAFFGVNVTQNNIMGHLLTMNAIF